MALYQVTKLNQAGKRTRLRIETCRPSNSALKLTTESSISWLFMSVSCMQGKQRKDDSQGVGEPPAFFKEFLFPLLLVCLWISVTQTDIFLSLLMTHVLMTGCLQTMLKTHRQVSRAFAFPASLKHPLKLKMGKWKRAHSELGLLFARHMWHCNSQTNPKSPRCCFWALLLRPHLSEGMSLCHVQL